MNDSEAKIIGQLVELSGIVQALRAEKVQLEQRVKFLEEMLRDKINPTSREV